MSFRAALVLLATRWQLSLSVRPEQVSLESHLHGIEAQEASGDAPEGWSEVLIPVDPSGDLQASLESHFHGSEAQGTSADAPEGWSEALVPVDPSDGLGPAGQSHSQVGQDKLVQWILQCKRNGFYLDLAANDAVHFSNTVMLERDFNWSGICMEANPQYMPGLAKRRQCQVVLAAVGSPSGQEVTFAIKNVYGGIVGDDFDNTPDEVDGPTMQMETKAFAEILEDLNAPEVIDYLSLDVEGAESFVMTGFPWDKHHIRVMTVERPPDDLKEVLKSRGYRFLRENSLFHDETWVDAELFQEVSSADWLDNWKVVTEVPSDISFHETCPLDTQPEA